MLRSRRNFCWPAANYLLAPVGYTEFTTVWDHFMGTPGVGRGSREKHVFFAALSMSAFGLITSALPLKADVNRDTCLRLLVTQSGRHAPIAQKTMTSIINQKGNASDCACLPSKL